MRYSKVELTFQVALIVTALQQIASQQGNHLQQQQTQQDSKDNFWTKIEPDATANDELANLQDTRLAPVSGPDASVAYANSDPANGQPVGADNDLPATSGRRQSNSEEGRMEPEVGKLLTLSNDSNSSSSTYERVVLAGSTISISCLEATKKWLSNFRQPPSQQELEQVHWFRNHVQLRTQRKPSVFDRSEANIITRQLTSVPNESSSRDRGLRRHRRRHLESNRLGEAGRRKWPNILPKADQVHHDSRWHLGDFGQLVIERVSPSDGGRYSCRVGGTKPEVEVEVLIDVLGQPEVEGAELASRASKMEAADGLSIEQPDKTHADLARDLARKSTRGHAHARCNANTVGCNYRSSTLKSSNGGKDALDWGRTEKPANKPEDWKQQQARHMIDAKPDVQENTSNGWPFGGDKSTSTNTGVDLNDIDGLGSSWHTGSGTNSSPGSTTQKSRSNRVHFLQAETIKQADISELPGFLNSHLVLHCPSVRLSDVGHSAHLFRLLEGSFCGPDEWIASDFRSELALCRTLVRNLAQRLLSELRPETNSSKELLKPVWFHDGHRLQFDELGAAVGRDTPTSLRLLSSNSDGNSLELDGQQRQMAGSQSEVHSAGRKFTCALELANERLVEALREAAKLLRRRLEPDRPITWSSWRQAFSTTLTFDESDRKVASLSERIVSNEANSPGQLVDRQVVASGAGSALEQQQQSETIPPSLHLPEADGELAAGGVAAHKTTTSTSSNATTGPGEPSRRLAQLIQINSNLKSILSNVAPSSSKAPERSKRHKTNNSHAQPEMGSAKALDFIEMGLSRITGRGRGGTWEPIQTFAVSLIELPANSCDLWQGITSASAAFQRRIEADFGRLKRQSLVAEPPEVAYTQKSSPDYDANEGSTLRESAPQPEGNNDDDQQKKHQHHDSDSDIIPQQATKQTGDWPVHVKAIEKAQLRGPSKRHAHPVLANQPLGESGLSFNTTGSGRDDDDKILDHIIDEQDEQKSEWSPGATLGAVGPTRLNGAQFRRRKPRRTDKSHQRLISQDKTTPPEGGHYKLEHGEKAETDVGHLSPASPAIDRDPLDPSRQLASIQSAETRSPEMGRPLVHDDSDALWWRARQYVYIHTRASTWSMSGPSSSFFGAQVEVEWSNEHQWNLSTAPMSPFAVIDVVAGQDLRLECTAQALGRLPDVKWYKRVEFLTRQAHSQLGHLARRIGNDLYWPLTELEILDDDLASRGLDGYRGCICPLGVQFESPDSSCRDSRGRRFVSSQSSTIFDNLANQTFTVVERLHLSQFNDWPQPSNCAPGSPGEPVVLLRNGKLRAQRKRRHLANELPSQVDRMTGSSLVDETSRYVCIVDADVRHNYATLGVRLRPAHHTLPPEVRKRLRARSLLDREPVLSSRSDLGQSKMVPSRPNYQLLRQNHIQLPFDSIWIPIRANRNSSDRFARDPISFDTLSLTFGVLSVIIVIVFSSLLGLVYLTLRSYQSFLNLQVKGELANESRDGVIYDVDEAQPLVYLNGGEICTCRQHRDLLSEEEEETLLFGEATTTKRPQDGVCLACSTVHNFYINENIPPTTATISPDKNNDGDLNHNWYAELADELNDDPHDDQEFLPSTLSLSMQQPSVNMIENPMCNL